MKIQFVSCHRKPERSFFYKGKQFPVCARCTGISLGYVVLPLATFNILELSYLWCFIFIIPTYLDGTLQAVFPKYESTNILRLLTGILSGAGQAFLVAKLGKAVGNFILNYI